MAAEAFKTGKTIRQLAVREHKYLTQEKWDELFSIENLINHKFITN